VSRVYSSFLGGFGRRLGFVAAGVVVAVGARLLGLGD